MFVLCSKISITSKKNGDFAFNGVNDLRIKRSIGTYVDTCTIKIPTTSKLNTSSSPTEQAVYAFVAGDAITVDLGYNNEFKKEFKGFISKVGYSTPVEVECEGYSYLLKRKNINKSWKTTTLREVCEYITDGTGIKLSPAIPNIDLKNYVVHNATATKVLDYLIEQYKLVAYFNFDELYVGLEELAPAGNVAYAIGYNTVDTNSLKYQHADDVKIKIVAKTTKKDGAKELYTCGDADGSVREIIVKNSETLDQVKRIANDYLAQKKYTGFTGSFTAFGQPYASIGFSCKLKDTRYTERSGTYFVYSIEVSYGLNGFRRIIELTKKLNSNG
jgi:hypothetical protein